MAVYIVTYDLNKETKRPDIVGEIKKYGSWAKLSESSYAISTSETVAAVYGKMQKHLDQNDNLYVITLKRPYTGFGQKDVNDWLASNLTY